MNNESHVQLQIMFTYETILTSYEVLLYQNCRCSARDNSHRVINCKDQYSRKVNVWCRNIGDGIIRLCLSYHWMLVDKFFDGIFLDAIENVPHNVHQAIYKIQGLFVNGGTQNFLCSE